MKIILLILCTAVYSSSGAQAPPAAIRAGQADSLYRMLEAGDTRGCFEGLRTCYAALGIRFADALVLHPQPFDEPLSFYNHDNYAIRISEMMREPAQGSLYWQNWSRVLTGGKWDPRSAWGTEKEMMLAGNFAILGILAHEMGHAADYSYGLSEWRAPAWKDSLHQAIREAVADELAIAVLRQLAAADARFARLLEGYRRWTVVALRQAAPAERQWKLGVVKDLIAYAAAHEAPAEKDIYVSYQLARQEWLLSWKGLPAWLKSLRSHTRQLEQRFDRQCRRTPGKGFVETVAGIPARTAKPAGFLDMPPFRYQGDWAVWQMNWQRDPARDTAVYLRLENDTAAGRMLSLQPLLNWGRANGIGFPARHSGIHNLEYYIWDIWPVDSHHYRALLSDNRKIYYSGTRPALSRLWLLEYRPGADPVVAATDSLVFPDCRELTASLRQQADGSWRIFLFRQQGNEESGLYEQYKITDKGRADRLFAVRAWHQAGGTDTDGAVDTVKLDWYRVIRQGVAAAGGALIWGHPNRLRSISPLLVETLAGERLPGAQDGDARRQVCYQPIAWRVLPDGGVLFWNKEPSRLRAGEEHWRLKKLERH